jgi:hypothetical protein
MALKKPDFFFAAAARQNTSSIVLRFATKGNPYEDHAPGNHQGSAKLGLA